MNVLDENITPVQRERLRKWRIRVRHIGYDMGQKGMNDEEIIPFLLTLPHPTFFPEDWDYFKQHLCHDGYCLVHIDVRRDELALFIRRFLRHKGFDTQAKRKGTVVRVSHNGIVVWRIRAQEETYLNWED
jgi:hypothetical protein